MLPTDEAFTPAQTDSRHPRTAVGQLADGRIVFVAVDGRQAWSAGLDVRELARELVRLGTETAIAFDGGGGTALGVEGRLLNTPSDGSERPIANALMLLYYGAYAPEPAAQVLSPNGDGVTETQRLAYKIVRPSEVDVQLIGPGGGVFWRDSGQKQAGRYSFAPEGAALREGRWRWVVFAVDADGNESRAQSREARVTVTVRDGSGRTVRTLASTRLGKGQRRLTWSGRDGSGRLVSAGTYRVAVRAANSLGTVALSATVDVERGRRPR
jgi:hypothetical protein